MILQTVISQSNYKEDFFNEEPTVTWGAADTGDYPTISGVTKVDLFIPTISGVNTYNHHSQVVEYYGDGVIHVIYSTTNENEENPGEYIRYQKSENYGLTWTSPSTLLVSQDDITKDTQTDSGRVALADGFALFNDELYALIDVNDRSSINESSPRTRTGVGALAVKINSNGTFGTPVWIDTPTGSFVAPAALGGFPSYSFDESLRTNLRNYLTVNPTELPYFYFSVPDSDFLKSEGLHGAIRLVEPSVCRLPSGQYFKLWRQIDTAPLFKVGQTSNYGHIWGDTFITEIPDQPSRTTIFNISSVEIGLTGNNGNASRDSLFFSLSDDGTTYSADNTHNIDKDITNPQFAGIGKSRGCQYPAAIKMSNGKIIVAYSVAKEKIRVAIFDKPTLI